MNCRTCQYPLWNLKSRICPECGSPFAPSEFEFAINSVQFRCPHCEQPYYGTSERGHLVPPEFDCVKCGRHIRMDEMVLLPTEGVREEQTSVDRSPWLDRRGWGVSAWFKTVGWALFQPRRLIRASPPDSSTGAAILFAIVTNGIYAAVSIVPIFVFSLVMMPGGMRGAAAGNFGAFAAGAYLVLAVLAGVWVLVAHGLLVATGPTAGGLGRTVQVICYSSAANALLMVPCLGFYAEVIGILWWAICAATMAVEAQRVSPWRAILAMAVPPVVLTVLAIGGMIMLFVRVMAVATALGSAASTPGSAAPPGILALARPAQTQPVLDTLIAYGRAHNGKGPDHAARLVLEGQISPETLAAGGSGLPTESLTAGGAPLSTLPGIGEAGESAVGRAAAGLPAGTVAYRLGDYVFTYPGIDLAAGDPDLWLVVCAPDQAAPWATKTPGAAVPVGRLGGTVVPIAGAGFPAALAEQNELRAKYGLAPLSDPALTTDGSPQVGGK